MIDRLLKRREVQDRLSIGHYKFFEMVHSCELEAVKLGAEWRVSESVLDAFKANLPKSTAVQNAAA